MAYKNPKPSVDDEHISKTYSLTFNFEEEVSLDEAVTGINELIKENDGKILKSWLKIGSNKKIRFALNQD